MRRGRTGAAGATRRRTSGRRPRLRRLLPIPFVLGLALAALLPTRAEEPQPTARRDSIRDFDLPDLSGTRRSLAEFRGSRVLVFAWTAPGCPVARLYAGRIAAFAKATAPRGVTVLGVESDAGAAPEEIRVHVEETGLAVPVLLDAQGTLAQRLGAETTTCVVVVDENRRVRYRGAFDDQYGVDGRKPAPTRRYVEEAVEAVLAHRAVATPETEAPGCPITFPAPAAAASPGPGESAEAVPTWAEGAAVIVHARCAPCHRPGEGGPFPLIAHGDLRGRTAVLAEVIEQGRMPPWGAEAPHGTFRNDRRLLPEEKALLLRWLTAGAPEGDPARAPAPPGPVTAGGWEIGTPDAVFQLPAPQRIPADGVVPYVFAEVPTDFPEDRWVEASEVVPGDPGVVHHVLVALADPGQRQRRRLFDPQRGFFAAMVPGGRALVYPPGMAKRLPKGAVLVFQLHYTPNGVATEDRTRIGLRFAKEPPRQEVFTAGAFNPRLRIPAGAPHHTETAVLPVPWNVRILAFMPHAHVRGTSFRYEVFRFGEQPRTVLHVPKYDFNWQTPYRLTEPLPVARGSWIKVHATYDNSYANPWNPDPTREVRWGDQTWDEMLIGYLDYVREE